MFDALIEKLKPFAEMDGNSMIHDVLEDTTLQKQIIDLNQAQLYEQGIQADGSPTGDYAPITITKWKPLALYDGRDGRSDHITGKDTGETYDSMKVQNNEDNITITAIDRNNFFDREPEGLGLTDESINEIIPEIKDSIIEKLKDLL